MRVLVRRRWSGLLTVILLAQGCASESQMQVLAPAPASATSLSMRLEPCIDRTVTKERDLAAEATRLIAQGLRSTPEIALRDDAPWVLSCEVAQFIEGSAFKRWLMPGWGSTVGQVAIMISNAIDQSVVVIIRGNSTVSAGGLYTVGAEDYILKSAIDDAISRLRTWAAKPAAVRDEL
jgi:hypothetical protein